MSLNKERQRQHLKFLLCLFFQGYIYSTVTRERKLYEIDCNLIKDKLTEQICVSVVAFFVRTHQLVLQRNAECKSSAHVIEWFKKDPSAGFYDKPDVNEATLDKKIILVLANKAMH